MAPTWSRSPACTPPARAARSSPVTRPDTCPPRPRRGAEATPRAALAVADRLGLANVAATARHNLGPVLARLGRLDEARQLEGEAIQAFRAQRNRRLEGGSHLYLAQILLESGDVAAA